MLTTYAGEEDIHQALMTGALAYLLKDTFCDEIVSTLRSVHAGVTISPSDVRRAKGCKVLSTATNKRPLHTRPGGNRALFKVKFELMFRGGLPLV